MTKARDPLLSRLEPGISEVAELLLKQVIDHVAVSFWVVDSNGIITLSTGLGLRALGLNTDQMVGQSIEVINRERPETVTAIRGVLAGESLSWKNMIGAHRYEHHAAPRRAHDGQVIGAVGVSVSLTERHEQESLLLRMAYNSALTGLPNRAQVVEWLQAARRNKTPVSLVHFDLDHFGRINESFGRELGDSLIRAAGVRLREVLPDNVALAHLGGDHFAAVYPDGDESAAVHATKLALDAFRESLSLEQGAFFCTLSAGIALMGNDTPDDWLNRAEIALHHAKDAGRNRCLTFRNEFIDHIREDTRIYLELRKALDLGALEVRYEPQISLQNRRVVGFEALARWRHTPLSGVTVADTIRVAEESGLIREITRQVLGQIKRDLLQWRTRLGPRLPTVSINVNSDEFVDPSFMTLLDSVISDESGLAPFIRVEITESAMMASPAEARRVLLALRQRGVMASLDDFGTGFSSLSLLHELPVDELKIDRSLLPGPNNPVPTSLVRTVMALASLLRLRTTVEGVETPEQERLMTTLGCDHAQGFLYSRALNADAACEMAAAYPSPFAEHFKGPP